jgi:hypothetical protein
MVCTYTKVNLNEDAIDVLAINCQVYVFSDWKTSQWNVALLAFFLQQWQKLKKDKNNMQLFGDF